MCTDEQIKRAAKNYETAVTGPMSGCKYPEEVLRWMLNKCKNGACRQLAENFIRSGHGACWNAMVNCMPANAWLVWYAGGWEGVAEA